MWHLAAELTNRDTPCPQRRAPDEDDPETGEPGQGNEDDFAPGSSSVDGHGVVRRHSFCLSSRSAGAT